MIEIIEVERINDQAMKIIALVGDIEITFIRPKDGEFPKEVSRLRHDLQILARDTLWIPAREYRELCRKVYKIFSEDRSKSSRKKKAQKDL